LDRTRQAERRQCVLGYISLADFRHPARYTQPWVSTRVLIDELSTGADAAGVLNRIQSSPPPAVTGLWMLEEVTYLGPSPNLNSRGARDNFQVYALDFADGERICGFKQQSIETAICV
jgi:hypothetical protein